MKYLGIDPGMGGGLALVNSKGELLSADKMPKDLFGISDWFSEVQNGKTKIRTKAIIEFINPGYKGSNKSSMSKLYGSYMSLQSFLVAFQIPYQIVAPRKWQAEYGMPSRKEMPEYNQRKRRLKEIAEEISGTRLTLATADAVLIADYAQKFYLRSEDELA